MIRYESHCVNCDLPCIHESCPYYKVEVHFCDECGEEADYILDGDDYCEDCAEEYMSGFFKELSIKEKAEVLGIEFKNLRE